MEYLFYLVAGALFLSCLTHANAMNADTRFQMKFALWVLMAGDIVQVLACAYDHMTTFGIMAATIVSAAMTLWLFSERRLERAEP